MSTLDETPSVRRRLAYRLFNIAGRLLPEDERGRLLRVLATGDPDESIPVDWVVSVDCRSEEGVVVGLIDACIAQARIVAAYLRTGQNTEAVAEALADLRADEDVALISAYSAEPSR